MRGSYELQIAESARGAGHGERLMRVLEGFGRNVGLGKAMLTVFAENTEAIRFYRRIGFVPPPPPFFRPLLDRW
jgi:ribosomal protein S18 acetylase RimI-like enzyme